MSPRIPPRLDLAVLCNSVSYDLENRVSSLNEPLHTVLLAPHASGRLLAPVFYLYVQMTDEEASGSFPLSIEVRTETNIVIRPAQVNREPTTFTSRYAPPVAYEHVFEIRDLVFPAPGWYHFHVMCRYASMSEQRPDAARPARLHVIHAELPSPPRDES